jgi:hypothetical protein
MKNALAGATLPGTTAQYGSRVAVTNGASNHPAA